VEWTYGVVDMVGMGGVLDLWVEVRWKVRGSLRFGL
jgi:hypothetical protein